MASVSIENTKTGVSRKEGSRPARLAPNYWPFVIPALVVISAVIVFPWVFTLWMSAHRWTLGQEQSFIGFENYVRLASDARFWESLWHTLVYTVLSVVAPLFLGTLAALVFDAQFPLRGFLRGVFVMPMMATPVAIALVWTMMFHAARRPELSPVLHPHRPAGMDLQSVDRHSVAGAGRNLAMDAARHADRARWVGGCSARTL